MSLLVAPPSKIGDEEVLARYVVYRKYIRADLTLRPGPFIPHPYPDLSVTRHIGLTEHELWHVGEGVATASGNNLYGRGDVSVAQYEGKRLTVKSDPVAGNLHHANVVGWPPDKPSQIILAQEISRASRFVPKP